MRFLSLNFMPGGATIGGGSVKSIQERKPLTDKQLRHAQTNAADRYGIGGQIKSRNKPKPVTLARHARQDEEK